MAAGDAVVSISAAVADDGFLDVRPGSGVEWSIHNLFAAGAAELYFYDGTNSILIDSGGSGTTSGISWTGMVFEVTNSIYLRVKNVSGSTANLGYSGRVTK